MKRLIKYSNSLIFLLLLALFLVLQSSHHFSTSLLSILPPSQEKALLTHFEETKKAKTLLLAVKGFDEKALRKIDVLEKTFSSFENLNAKSYTQNKALEAHLKRYVLYSHDINQSKVDTLNVSHALAEMYAEMTESFFPVQVNQVDPFSLLQQQPPVSVPLENGHLILKGYGYLSIFTVTSKTLEEHTALYKQIHTYIAKDGGVKVFSPIFYYVENSQAIRGDINTIMLISVSLLLLLYLIILRNLSLLVNTMLTLASSALVASLLLTIVYDEVSIFVFVFGISISTVAVDYMFHHYLHDYYTVKKRYNKEVLFGFLTTISAFFILSFTSFLLIKQISLFALISLFTSYLIFAFLYPQIGFKSPNVSQRFSKKSYRFLRTKPLFVLSIFIIVASSFWIGFDFNLKNLDYDNKTLKATQNFFSRSLSEEKKIPFAIRANKIDTLIDHAKVLRRLDPSINMPLANLVSVKSYQKNNAILEKMSDLRTSLAHESEALGFKKGYFKDAYAIQKKPEPYTLEKIRSYGLELVYLEGDYLAFGQTNVSAYKKIKKFSFVESLSLKERFETMMHESMGSLMMLGLLALCVILVLLYSITGASMLYAVIFLLFPTAMISLYGLFVDFNILHIFMLFIILSIGIDYAIYLSKDNDPRTQQAIGYSLISTFAGFGVLVFSQINALYSLGLIATLGIMAIFILLLALKRSTDAS